MFRFGSIFLASVYSLMIRICGLIYKYVYRSKSCLVEEDGSNFGEIQNAKAEDSVFLQGGLISNYRSKSCVGEEDGSNFSDPLQYAKTEDSVFLQSGLISNSSKCQVMSGKNVRGFFEEAKTVKFVVHEMFDDVVRNDQDIGCEIDQRKEQEKLQEFDEELEPSSFYFNLLDGSCSIDVGTEEREESGSVNEKEKSDLFDFRAEGKDGVEDEVIGDHDFSYEHRSKVKDIDQESEQNDHLSGFCSFEVCEGREEQNLSDFRVEGEDHMEDETVDDQDFSYEVELLPTCPSSSIVVADKKSETLEKDILIVNQGSKGNDSVNWMRDFLDELDRETPEFLDEIIINSPQKEEDSDEEFIELENLSFKPTSTDNESSSTPTPSMEIEQMQEKKETTTLSQEGTSWLDSESDDEDEDETDVLSEHQNLVQQMKMELKNCRIKGLPTISEECESPKMVDDLRPLDIDHKIEYKDVMEEIQMFYKCYSEKMRKLDILNYQTLHAISFLQLKDSEVFNAGKKKPDLISFVMPKILARKDQRVYADPMHKSINEMHRDLELVYVGHLCLSWEILCWLYAKAQTLVGYNLEGSHSYNRSAEDFQQFQVLLQRFVEDEQFSGHRNQNYVKNRCMIRSLLQVPTIKDDCCKNKKERREETDAISLEMLVEIMRESMLIFQDFLFADKKSTNVVLKGVKGSKVDLQGLGNSELLSEIMLDLQKKERRIRDQIRSRNCIVNKMKRDQERRPGVDVVRSQVELRLVWRVLNMSKLTTDQLVWCKNKLSNISFVGRKVQIEPCFLLFPC